MNPLHLLILISYFELMRCGKEEEEGVKYANKCEVCKIVSTEISSRLMETGKTSEVIETGYSIDKNKKKRTKYKVSELRLVETLDNICERILEYNIHKERQDSTRFAKGMSQTFQTLHGLVNKGVKVELGMPYELWDKPSAEITNMKTQCETLIEDYEDDIGEWYFHQQQDISLQKFLCTDRVLQNEDDSCLKETVKVTNKKRKGETKEEL
ncbi:hypothetical protein RUM44_011033 [Polyplax serrata]|uniref:DUF3456 domain-containing protein n=1 Tax=Polyplax serrata TaxID=468196 RepID=A0ABR1ANV5_POLSC